MDVDPNQWKPNGAAYVWMARDAFERIEQSLDQNHAATATLTYLALSRICCREGTATVKKSPGYIGKLGSLSGRTVIRRLTDLENIGLVKVTTSKIQGTNANDVNTYTLLTPWRKGNVTVTQPYDNVKAHVGRVPIEQKNNRSDKPLTNAQRVQKSMKLTELKKKLSIVEGRDFARHNDEWKAECDNLANQIAELETAINGR